jgi:hypothetical protein
MTTKRATQHGAQSQTLSTVEPALVHTEVQTPSKRKANLSSSGLIEKKSKVASEIRLVPPIFSKSGKNTNESIAFKNSNVAKASKKSIHVQVTETLSNEAINDDTNSVHSDPEMINDEVIQEGYAIRSAVFPTTSSSSITTRSTTVKYNYNIMTKVMQVFKGALDENLGRKYSSLSRKTMSKYQ